MFFFFVLKLIGFFTSILVLNRWINRLLNQWQLFDSKYLPCFASGWLVYLAIYVIGRGVAAPIDLVHNIYTLLSFSIPLFASGLWCLRLEKKRGNEREFIRSFRILDRYTMLLLVSFVVSAIYVGPYLEFPSDPIEHLYRIQAWEKAAQLDHEGYHYSLSRFIYFFEHWMLKSTSLDLGERSGLVLLSPLLQGMLFWQFIRITKLLINSTVLGWLGGIMSLGYFGYSAISFYRYTVLAGALLAFIVCLDGFVLIIATFLKEKFRYLFLLPPLLYFCQQKYNNGGNRKKSFAIYFYCRRYCIFAGKITSKKLYCN